MGKKLSFNAGCGWTDRTGKKCYSYCHLDDPSVNRKLASDIPEGATEDEITLITAWLRLPKRLRDLVGKP